MTIKNMTDKEIDFILKDLRAGIPLEVIANTCGCSIYVIREFKRKYEYFKSVWKPFKQASWDEEKDWN